MTKTSKTNRDIPNDRNDVVIHTNVLFVVLSCLDTATLTSKKVVCVEWNDMCTAVIAAKVSKLKIPFQTRGELKEVVEKYMSSTTRPAEVEDIELTYGWPIGLWDVSNVTSMEDIFCCCQSFNEDIGLWS